MRKLARLTFRHQLVGLIVLVALVCGVVVGAVSIDRARAAVRADVLDKSLGAAELAANLTQAYLSHAVADARQLSTNPEIRTGLAAGDFEGLSLELDGWVASHDAFLNAGLVDLDGTSRASSRLLRSKRGELDPKQREWYWAVLLSRQPYMGAVGTLAGTELARIPFAIPVQDDAGALKAVLITAISLEQVSNALNNVQLGPNSSAALIDLEHRTIVSHSDRTRLLQVLDADNPWVATLARGAHGASEGHDQNGRPTLAAYAPLASLRWGVILEQPAEDAFRPVDEMVRETATIIGLLVVMAAGVGAALSLRVSRPVDAMAARLETSLSDGKHAAAELARLAEIVRSSEDAIVSQTPQGTVTSWNLGAERLYGYSAEEMIGRQASCLIPPECLDQMAFIMSRVRRGEPVQRVETVRLKRDGQRVEVALTLSPIVNSAGEVTGIAGIAHDITHRKRDEAVLRHQAWHDMLTGLPNRARLQAEIDDLVSRFEAAPFSLMLMDLDRFKEVNDTLGHHRGDQLLWELGQRLATELGDGAMLARLGGDEFAVLLPGCDLDVASGIAERLLATLERPFSLDGSDVEVGASIGIAAFPTSASDEDALLRCADVAMYTAKGDGRGFAVYSQDHDRNSAERLALVSDLRRAIELQELTLHFQPEVDVQTGELGAFEALVRWNHPTRGVVRPTEFIALAEQTRLIRPLSRWVIRTALRQARLWDDSLLAVPIAVNLSVHDLQDSTLPEFVEAELTHCGVPGKRLCVEITESSLMAEPEAALATLRRLRALGVRIAIDDFGIGYSSFEYLRDLPVDTLKIDRSFIRDMKTNTSSRSIVRAITDLAHDLGLRVVAEGVENDATWKLLTVLGCDLAQGFYFSAALPAADIPLWLRGTESHTQTDLAA